MQRGQIRDVRIPQRMHDLVMGGSSMKIKHCRRCGKDRPIIFFARDRTTKDGRTCYCKSCKREQVKRWMRETTGKGVGKMLGDDWMSFRKVRD